MSIWYIQAWELVRILASLILDNFNGYILENYIKKIFAVFSISFLIAKNIILHYPLKDPNESRYGFWKVLGIFNLLSLQPIVISLRCPAEMFFHIPSLRWIVACSIIHILQAQSTCAEIITADTIPVSGEQCRVTAAVSGSFAVSFKLETTFLMKRTKLKIRIKGLALWQTKDWSEYQRFFLNFFYHGKI